MQQAVVLFGGGRWGKEYVADMIRATGAELIWPNEWQRAQDCEQVVVIALHEYIAEEALTVAEKLGVPFYPTESHFITFHKHRLRALWNELAAANPDLMAVPFEWLTDGAPSIAPPPFPLIIKPDAYSGSVGVKLVKQPSELNAALAQLRHILKQEQAAYVGDFDVCQDILLEQAIPRKAIPNCESEFTLHMLSRNGQHSLLATAEKQLYHDSYIEVGHTVPAVSIPLEYIEIAVAASVQMLQQLDAQQCISNWEFIITPNNQVALVEGQLRPSGDRLMQLIQLATGINPFAALLHGETNPAQHKTACIKWLGPEDVLLIDGKYTIPNLPIGWEAIIDETALRNNPNWPGPIDWYNRHVAVVGTL
jgi:D-alanine-D-alanine ligase-like ATP-grasp enzyme